MSDSRRRITIKPYRMNPQMDRNEAAATWDKMSNAIDEIYNRNASQLSFEELYRATYNLVLQKHAAALYEGVSEKIQQHLTQTVTNELQTIQVTTSIESTSSSAVDGYTITTTGSGGGGNVSSSNTSNASFLEAVSDAWNEHCITMIMIRDILMYMDRTYCKNNKRRPVYELGLHLFRVTVWEHPSVRSTVIELLLDAIHKERIGQLLDDRGATVKKIVGMLLELGRADYAVLVYQEDFERIFLSRTQEFYHSESLQYLSKATASDYVKKAIRRIEEEKVRALHLQLPQTTTGPLQTIVQTEWIERHAPQLVEMESTGFAALLQQAGTSTSTGVLSGIATATPNVSSMGDDKVLQEMRGMYELFVRVPSSVDYLRDALADRIKASGKQLIHDQITGQADPVSFVRGVLDMRQKYETVVQVAFGNEKKAQKRMKESFEEFLNVDARAASCLALYVDELLRTGLRRAGPAMAATATAAVASATTGPTQPPPPMMNNTNTNDDEEQINIELQKVIVVFRYLYDKDVFESFYKQHLAKRLLGNKSISDEAERSMVSKLKQECGYQFTTKLEGMFNDMRISRETREKYKEYRRSSSSNQSTVEIDVDVLTTGYWPSQNVAPCILPGPIQNAIDQFSKFYLEKHTGRKLSWQTSAGAGELKAMFGAGNGTSATPSNRIRHHELCVSTYQMCILLLFNSANTLTLGQIRTQTHIPDMELRRHLISLCTPKNRILKKGSKGKGIVSDSDTFTFNDEYTSKLKRVKIQLVKETSITSGPTNNTGNQQQQQESGQNPSGDASGTNTTSHHMGGTNTGGEGGANSSNNHVQGTIPTAVEEDRRHLVEAAIVRIMKARKSLNHNDLIAEVTKQLSVRFNPLPVFIKKRIESLIDREYLERENNEHRTYLYIA